MVCNLLLNGEEGNLYTLSEWMDLLKKKEKREAAKAKNTKKAMEGGEHHA